MDRFKQAVRRIFDFVRNNNFLRAVVILLLTAWLLEVLVFNFRFVASVFEKNKAETVRYTFGAGLQPVGGGAFTLTNSGEKTIELKDLNRKVSCIYLSIRSQDARPENQAVSVSVLATDRGNQNYYELPARDIVRNVEKSKYLQLYTYGESKDIKIRINAEAGKTVYIEKIMINKPRPLLLSFGRLVVVFGFLLLIYILRPGSGFYQFIYRHKSWPQRVVTLALCGSVCLLFYFNYKQDIVADRQPGGHHAQYTQLTDAILKGHVYLDETPPEALAGMQNPYDSVLRNQVMTQTKSGFQWDTAYYNGKYYVYFGITPVILLYLPYKAITGNDFWNNWAVLIFCCISVFAMFGIVGRIIRKWFTKTPFLLYIMLSLTCLAGCGTVYLIGVQFLYEVPIAGALALSLSGLYFWLSSVKDDGSGVSVWRVLMGSLCIALSAGCRPQVLLCALLGVPIFWRAFKKDRILFSKKSVGATAALCVPFLVIGAGLMYYNYIRFGSVIDFGMTYNLTLNDMNGRGFSWARVPSIIWMYFLQPANISTKFPFVMPAEFHTDFLIKSIVETTYGGLFNNLLIFANVLIIKYRKELREKGLFAFVLTGVFASFAIAMACGQLSGILARYYADFAWLMLIPACVMVLVAHERLAQSHRRYLYMFVSVCLVTGVLFNILGGPIYVWKLDWNASEPNIWYSIQNAVQFWL